MMKHVERILELPLPPNDSGEATVRGYLVTLLQTAWIEEESFSGKRPFGNSGWKYDIYAALVKADFINGTLDENGYVDDCDHQAADNLIREAIELFRKQG